jgi:hypothetical protein
VTYILGILYSWPVFIGAMGGALIWSVYCRQKAHYLDKHNPLSDGAKHQIARLNRLWVAGLCLALSLGYILLSANRTHDQTVALANNVTRCWAESYAQAKAQIDLNAQNDIISRQQQALQRKFDVATSDWLKEIITPPDDLATRNPNDPIRQTWALQRTAVYQAKLDDLGAQSDTLVAQRQALDDERAKHQLPEPTCGK